MIQEILDYLLIRSVLLNSTSEEMINMIGSKEDFEYIVNNISSLMQQEDFLLLDNSLQKKVSDIIQAHRFDYNHDKELNDQMNYIISRLQEYKVMNLERRRYLINDWIKQEGKIRELPWYYHTKENLLPLISLDTLYFQGMVITSEKFEIDHVVEYLSILNIILNKFPDYFKEDQLFLELSRENCAMIADISNFPRFILKMNKRVLKRLNENYETNQDISKKVKGNVTYELKKKER